jgi:chemotaxis protein CheX
MTDTTKPDSNTATPAPRKHVGPEVNYINPFIEAAQNAFKSMVNEVAVRKSLSLKGDENKSSGVSGIIGLAGETMGSVVLSLNEETAMKVISKIMGTVYTDITADVIDGVGELTNIIAGDAKNRLIQKGYKFDISIPRVVSGRQFLTTQTKNIPCIVIEFTIPSGGFKLEVCLTKGN